MADLTRTVEIIFGAVDNTGQAIGSVSQSLDSIVTETSKVTKPLSDVADLALKAETAIVAMGAALLAVSVNESAKFGQQIAEIGTLVNNTADQNDVLSASVQELARNVGSSNFDQLNQALYVSTSNLGDTSKAMDILAVAEKGAVVGATSLDSSAALLTRTMNAYGQVTDDSAKNTENAERVMAAMFATVQAGDTNMTALSENLGKVSSTAAAANVPIETLGAAIAALTGAGVSTDQSMTLLNSVIKELLDPSKDLTTALDGMTIAADGLPAIMDKLRDSTGGSADQIYQLFSSSEAAKGALILANDSAGKFHSTLTAMPNAVDNLNKNFEVMAENLTIQTQKMKNSWDAMFQTIGAPNQDNFIEIEKAFAKVFDAITASVKGGAFDDVYAAFDEFTKFFADKLNIIAKNLPAALEEVDFSGLIAAMRDVGIEVGQLFGDIDLSTPEGLAKAIQFVIDSFDSLTRVVSGIIDVWGPVVQGVIDGVDTFNALDEATKKTAGNVLGISQVFESLKGAVLTGAGALEVISNAMELIAGIDAAKSVTSLAKAVGSMEFTAGGLALAAIGYAIKKNTEAYEENERVQRIIDESSKSLAETQGKLAEKYSEISQTTGVAVNSMDELNKAVDDGRLVFNEATGAYEAAGSGIRDYDAEISAATDTGDSFADAVNEVAKSLGISNDATEQATQGFKTLEEAQGYAAEQFSTSNNVVYEFVDGLWKVTEGAFGAADAQTELTETTKEATKAATEGTAEWKRVQDVFLESQKIANDYQIALGELAAQRYEIDVTAAVDLRVAEIEAQTAQIQAAFQATAEVIDSLTQGTSDIWSTFAGGDFTFNPAKGRELERAAKRMEDRLDAELAIKREMTDAIVEKMKAESLRLQSGEPLISMDAGSLAPELELVFDKILKYTQIRATQEGLSLLVGLS